MSGTRRHLLALCRATLAVWAVTLCAPGCAAVGSEGLSHPVRPAPPSAERGRAVYRNACAACHGIAGDGKGPGAAGLDPAPRDLTRGVFRHRSTPSGSLPLDSDLERTILDGLAGTAMPAWRGLLSTQEVTDVVAYVKGLSPRFAKRKPRDPIQTPAPVATSPESIARGRAVYEKSECGKCHGKRGQGDGWAKGDEMRDDQGHVVRTRDFTSGSYRGGGSFQDLYRTIQTGLDGSPMPSYEASLTPAETYDLVNFIVSLERDGGVRGWLSAPSSWQEPCEERTRW